MDVSPRFFFPFNLVLGVTQILHLCLVEGASPDRYPSDKIFCTTSSSWGPTPALRERAHPLDDGFYVVISAKFVRNHLRAIIKLMLNALDFVRRQLVSVGANRFELFILDQNAVLVRVYLIQFVLPVTSLVVVVFKDVLPSRHKSVDESLGFIKLHLLLSVQRLAPPINQNHFFFRTSFDH